MRSALVVIHSEMSVSPIKVKVNSRPICASLKPGLGQVKHEHDGQEPVGKQARDAGGEQHDGIPAHALTQ